MAQMDKFVWQRQLEIKLELCLKLRKCKDVKSSFTTRTRNKVHEISSWNAQAFCKHFG